MATAIHDIPDDVIKLAYELAHDPNIDFLLERRELELSFKSFVQAAWPLIEPATPFVPGKHIDAICDHLQAVTETHERLSAMSVEEIIEYRALPTDVRYLLITIPPRFSKSSIISVLWPAWEWTRDPSLRYLTSSYNEDLAERDARRTRDVIETEWYQQRWGHKVQLSDTHNKKADYALTASGSRRAIGVSGGGTGFGGDRILCDDPHNTKYSESDAIRSETIRWWDEVMSNRLNDPRRDAMIVVQQRVHDQDLAGHLIAQGGWVHLNLPMEYEGEKNRTAIGWEDWRTEEGEFLSPARFGPEEKRKKLLELGPMGYAGQYQQRPVQKGGAIFKSDAWEVYDNKFEALPAFKQVAAFVDTAGKQKEENDYTVFALWGRAHNDDMYLLDLFRGKPEFPDMVTLLKDFWTKWTRKFGASLLVVEDKGQGTSLIQTMKRETGIPTDEYKPDRDKVARANSSAGYQQGGKLFLPKYPGEDMDVSLFIKEHTKFPRDAHDDMVDTTTMMLMYWIIAPPEKKRKGRKRTGRLRKSGFAAHIHRQETVLTGRSTARIIRT